MSDTQRDLEERFGFHVGDEVEVLPLDEIRDMNIAGFTHGMEEWCGRQFVITELCPGDSVAAIVVGKGEGFDTRDIEESFYTDMIRHVDEDRELAEIQPDDLIVLFE